MKIRLSISNDSEHKKALDKTGFWGKQGAGLIILCSSPGRGGVAVSLMPSPAQLDGVRQYMSQYPYACLEQRTSKAVALGNSGAGEDPDVLQALNARSGHESVVVREHVAWALLRLGAGETGPGRTPA